MTIPGKGFPLFGPTVIPEPNGKEHVAFFRYALPNGEPTTLLVREGSNWSILVFGTNPHDPEWLLIETTASEWVRWDRKEGKASLFSAAGAIRNWQAALEQRVPMTARSASWLYQLIRAPKVFGNATVHDLNRVAQLANALDEDSPLSPDLYGYAAAEAITYLLANWRDAVASGDFAYASMLDDLSSMVEQLLLFQDQLGGWLGAERPSDALTNEAMKEIRE